MVTKLISASAGTGKTTKIIKELEELLKSPNIEAKQVVAITFTKKAAKELEQRIGGQKEGLFIGTIDSFFSKILKENAVKLNLSRNYEILGGAYARLILEDLAMKTIDKYIDNDEYKNLFSTYNVKTIRDSIIALQYASSLSQSKSYILQEHINSELESFKVDYYLGKFKGYQSKFKDNKDKLKNHIDNAVKLLENLEYTIKQIKEKQIEMPKLKHKLTELPKIDARSGSSKVYGDDLDSIKSDIKFIKYYMKSAFSIYNEQAQKDFIDNILRIAKVKHLLHKLYIDLKTQFLDFKKSENLLEFNDVQNYVLELVEKHNIADVYRKRYKYLLIDEFQDTNFSQKKILENFAENLIMVGDAKQSIYRFRKADVKVFVETENQQNIEKETLKINYRSSKKVVDFVNNLFKDIFTESIEYLEFKPRPDAPDGLVEHYACDNYEDFAKGVVEKIQELFKSGVPYSDNAILLKTRTHLKELITAFEKAGIPYGVDGTTYRKNVTVRLVSLLRVINDSGDDTDLMSVLKLPKFYMEDLDIINKTAQESLKDFIKNKHKKLTDFIDRAKTYYKTGNFMEFIDFVLKESLFIESMALLYPEEASGLDEAILQQAMDARTKHYKGLSVLDILIRYLENGELDNFVANSGPDSVKILTIHASKGLAFKNVFVPLPSKARSSARDEKLLYISQEQTEGINFSLKLNTPNEFCTPLYIKLKELEKKAEIEESKRLFYVACTRARDNLYLYTVAPKKEDGTRKTDTGSWGKFVNEYEAVDLKYDTEDTTEAKPLFTYKYTGTDILQTSTSKIKQSVSSMINLATDDFSYSSKNTGVSIHKLLEYVDEGIVFDEVKDFVNSSAGQEVFSKKGVNEYPFELVLEDSVITGRIDRFVVDNEKKEITVYDYKVMPEKAIMNKIEEYKKQLSWYRQFLETKYSGYTVRTKLVSVLDKKLIEL